MFTGWGYFYQLTGSAAATLTGLLFLAATLTSGRQASTMQEGVRLFSTPTVVQFASVVVASALALAPPPHDRWSAWALLGLALACVAYSLRIMVGLIRFPSTTHWSDPWFYGVLLVAAYAALALGVWTVLDHLPYGPDITGGAVLSLLLLAVRNAWDLITWLAPRRDQEDLSRP